MYEWGVERQQGKLTLRGREDVVSNPKPDTLIPSTLKPQATYH
jgi:hypothetical protein